jgi:hypothetical protein
LNDFIRIIEHLTTRHINVVDEFGFTPLDLALKYKNESVIKRIKDALNKAKIEVLSKNK